MAQITALMDSTALTIFFLTHSLALVLLCKCPLRFARELTEVEDKVICA